MNETPTTDAKLDPAAERNKFVKVRDRRGNPILGLWVRNNRYYLQMVIAGHNTKRALYNDNGFPVNNREDAVRVANYQRAKEQNRWYALPEGPPKLTDFVATYLHDIRTNEAKHPKTIDGERATLNGWIKRFGHLRIDQISLPMVDTYVRERKTAGVSNRTVNLDVLVLNNLLRHAKRYGYISTVNTESWEALPYRAPKRILRTTDEINALVAEALRVNLDGTPAHPNGRACADYILLMAYTGARRDSALAIQWCDVLWEQKKLWLRKTKYSHQDVYVDFHEDLELLLRDMESRAVRGETFLFPSPIYPGQPMTDFRSTFASIKEKTHLTDFTFHDLRHHFISRCVMAGIDFMTIASWVGHRDGGVLIGKVYGHLSDTHKRLAAAKLNQTAVKLPDSGVRDVEPTVQAQDSKPAGAPPAPDRSPTDTYAGTPCSELDGVNHLVADIADFLKSGR